MLASLVPSVRAHLLRVPLIALALFMNAECASADLIDLEDLVLAPESHYNGSDGAGGFFSGGAFFNNNYSPTFDSWSGWSYSNRTDVSTPGFLNQYSAYHLPFGGGDFSANYAIAFSFDPGEAYIALPPGAVPNSISVTNTTYAALSMREGDSFAKKFGGADGLDPDFFLLTIHGVNSAFELTGSVDFYLADFTFDDSSLDTIVSSWTQIDLSPLGDAAYLVFQLASSDVGAFGFNTPAFFALDNLEFKPPEINHTPEPTTLGLAAVGAGMLLGHYLRKRRKRNR